MKKVVSRTMLLNTILYCLVGTFGYLTFSRNTNQLTNSLSGGIILLADYQHSPAITLVLIDFLINLIINKYKIFFS